MWGCFRSDSPTALHDWVFPTHVGVFPGTPFRRLVVRRSSPRMWGCFPVSASEVLSTKVFPTHVGVFPFSRKMQFWHEGLPHACGGVSEVYGVVVTLEESSPRMWGCFHYYSHRRKLRVVFPTHVGVFLWDAACAALPHSLPHACGGVSGTTHDTKYRFSSSPRMWGCFSYPSSAIHTIQVFPTHVGVFPRRVRASTCAHGLPHACGGVSGTLVRTNGVILSSPRMWGCFCSPAAGRQLQEVFPTHVGVFLYPTLSSGVEMSLPHACGGVSSTRVV